MNSKLVLVLNCGSSSLKFAVLSAVDGEELLSGLAECLGNIDARIKYKLLGDKQQKDLGGGAAHREAVEFIVSLINANPAIADNLVAVGHRVVHGGETFTKSVLIDDTVIHGIEKVSQLAPLHNPANLLGIRAAKAAFPKLPQVAVFDTAFHQTMPQHAYLYALPYKFYREHGIRRYGFHGTSHYYVSRKAAEMLGKPISETNVIVAHLGNGASVCAVKGGKSVDTSMGMTPLEGLVMGTRCGDIDPSLPEYFIKQLGYSIDEVSTILNKQSGFLGLTEVSNDCRYVEDGFAEGKPDAVRAMEIFCYRLAKYIASYTAALGRLDAVVFTGGIGENGAPVRANTLKYLEIFGFAVDEQANLAARFGKSGTITSNSGPQALVIPTNEEWVIAQDSAALAGI